MVRPDFTLKWAGSRLSIPAISAGNYASGWDTYLGPLPPLGDDHDYVMNLQDSRAIWLGEQMLLAVGHEWQDDVSYDAYAVVRSPVNGQLYRSLVGSNLNNEPSVSGAQWSPGVQAQGLPPSHLSGLTPSTNVGAPTTTIDVSAGSARNLLNTLDINLAAATSGILQTSGAWAAGDGQNKILLGSRGANQTWHIFVIYNSAGANDIGLHQSLNPTADLPAGFTGYRRVGSLRTLSDGTIKRFEYKGNQCDFNNPLRDINVTGAGATTDFYTVGVPTGIQVQAIMQMFARSTVGSAAYNINEPGADDIILYNGPTVVSPAANQTVGFGRVYVFTNTSAQIQIAASVAGNTYSGGAYGFVDTREV